MRELLSFACEGAGLAATLDRAPGAAGLLIVSGGNEIRIGAHRGMARLAGDIAAAGHPVFRFDRRGVGDSEGENGGFETSGPEIAAAIQCFRQACPGLRRIAAFGNCDAASALLLNGPFPLDGLILANIWTVEAVDDLPPPAAIRARYLERLRDPKAWAGLISGRINFAKLARGLFRLAKPAAPQGLAARIGQALAGCSVPSTILLAQRDGTAIAFLDAWRGNGFEAARANPKLSLREIDSASHSFAGAGDYAKLKDVILEMLESSS